ncbi:MAG TPA: sugar transferase [Candidatus Acidoferrales bacterium]|nr:sugar transferase [Candidatus Acidoferrales bacterium]
MNSLAKRSIDLMGSILGLALLSPLMLVIALAILCTMGRPVFFRQRRPGYWGRPFWLVKFRTMSNARDPDRRLLPDDLRLTRLGRILRRTSLDELPELWNVAKGEMSLVGPRPLLMEYMDRYTPEQECRHHVKPGITGWAQINGRNALTWEQKFACDLWYVDHRCLWLDLRILLRTLWQVWHRDGISFAGHATMPAFMGRRESGAKESGE